MKFRVQRYARAIVLSKPITIEMETDLRSEEDIRDWLANEFFRRTEGHTETYEAIKVGETVEWIIEPDS